jgi:hypothetical protein
MKFYCIVFCLWLTNFVFAQQQADTVRNENQISRKWPGWKMNGKKISWKEVKNNIQLVPEAIPSLKKSINSKRIVLISAIPLTASLLFIQDPDFPQIRSTRNTIYYITNLVSTAFILYFGIRAIKKQQDAIRIYNEKRAIVY